MTTLRSKPIDQQVQPQGAPCPTTTEKGLCRLADLCALALWKALKAKEELCPDTLLGLECDLEEQLREHPAIAGRCKICRICGTELDEYDAYRCWVCDTCAAEIDAATQNNEIANREFE